jgi:hypothetical protein
VEYHHQSARHEQQPIPMAAIERLDAHMREVIGVEFIVVVSARRVKGNWSKRSSRSGSRIVHVKHRM